MSAFSPHTAAPGSIAEAGDDLVEDQDDVVALGERAQLLQVAGDGRRGARLSARGLEDHRRHVASLEQSLDRLDIVGRGEQELIEDLHGHSGRHGHVEGRVHRRHHAVMPAVEMAVELHHLRMPRIRARNAQGEVRRLGARHGEAHHLRGGHELADELGPADFQLVAGTEVRAPRRLLLNGLDHGRVAVTEEERAVTHPVVHVFVTVHVPLA